MEKYINNNNIVENSISDEYRDYVKCSKCLNILINPFICSSCHLIYCKKCANEYIDCQNCNESYYIRNLFLNDILSNLKFTCLLCKNIIGYYEVKNHYIIHHKDEFIFENYEDYKYEIIKIIKKLTADEMNSIKKQNQNIMNLTSKRNFQLIFIYINIVLVLGGKAPGKSSLIET